MGKHHSLGLRAPAPGEPTSAPRWNGGCDQVPACRTESPRSRWRAGVRGRGATRRTRDEQKRNTEAWQQKMGAHTVEKIGGTSMTEFEVVLENVIVGSRQPDELYNRIFVVSAYGGITDLLLEHKKSGRPGVYARFAANDAAWDDALQDVENRMCELNAGFAALGLDVDDADAFVRERLNGIQDCLVHLRKLCSYGHFQLDDYLPMVREMLSAVGEAHSARNSARILQGRGISASFVDLSGWRDDANLSFDEAISTAFEGVDVDRTIPVVTGYTKCAEGIMATYDRGYSEITFSKLATVTGACEGVIHKEFHLSSGDPKLIGVDNVRIIGKTNYDVADQLADLGMEAIHPRASKNMELADIPIRVKNAFEPEHPGTLIASNTFVNPEPRVEMVTGRKDVMAIEVWDPDMVGQSGYDYQLLSHFAAHDVSYLAKNTNANTITHYVPRAAEGVTACLDDLRQALPSAVVRTVDVCIVSAIGSNMKFPGFLARAANALAEADINILALDQCMRQVNMQFIVDASDFEPAIKVLHRALVENA
jgi:aspartate kinase